MINVEKTPDQNHLDVELAIITVSGSSKQFKTKVNKQDQD